MAFIPVPNTLQVELIYLWAGQVVETVLHYQPEGAIDVTEMAGLAANMVTWFDVQLQPLVHSTLQLTQVKVTDLTTDSAPVINYTTGLPLVGTVGADGMPNNVALVFTKRTGLRGRSYRGRIYHPGLAESQVAGNQVAGATVTSLLAAYNLLLAQTVAAETYNLVVVSRQHNNAVLEEGVATLVSSIDTDGFVDSQRRRLPGRGA